LSELEMKCEQVENLIYLKPDELEPNELELLEQHILSCESCKLNYEKQIKGNELIHNLAKNNSVVKFPEELTRQIMNNLMGKEIKPGWIDSLVELFFTPALRYAMIVFLFLLTAFYIYEEGKTVHSISILEAKSEQYAQTKMYSGYRFDESRMLNLLPNVISFLSGDKNYTELSDDLILMNKNGLRDLLVYSEFLNGFKSSLPKDFRQKYPDLTKAIESGSAYKLLNQSAEQKEKILIELNKLFSKGEK